VVDVDVVVEVVVVVDVLVGCVLFSRVFAFPFRRFVLPRF
jgi:hypothetical protein